MFLISSIIYLFLTFFFFFNDTATTEIYTLSLHDALPICARSSPGRCRSVTTTSSRRVAAGCSSWGSVRWHRSEEHTSELQSRLHLVCRLLLEKKTPPSGRRSPQYQAPDQKPYR